MRGAIRSSSREVVVAGARSKATGTSASKHKTGGKTQTRRAAASPAPVTPHFTHFDPAGQAHMVDIAAKGVTRRVARAGGRIVMLPDTLALIRAGAASKGDVLGVARIAAIQAARCRAAPTGVSVSCPTRI